jgi:hypothetical protein
MITVVAFAGWLTAAALLGVVALLVFLLDKLGEEREALRLELARAQMARGDVVRKLRSVGAALHGGKGAA